MKTFAERLKIALDKMGLSQAEAARRCGISQQSINYIITNNLSQSKLAVNISACLDINPNWLIYGEGRPKEIICYEIPVINTFYTLLKFIHQDINMDTTQFIVVDDYLGETGFAYLFEPNKLAICCEREYNFAAMDYLCISGTNIEVHEKPVTDLAFRIIEWRTRLANFQFS